MTDQDAQPESSHASAVASALSPADAIHSTERDDLVRAAADPALTGDLALALLQRADLPVGFVAKAYHAPCVLEHNFSGFGQGNVVHSAREQRRSDFVLDLFYALTDGGLSAADPLGRTRERALLTDR